MIANVHPEHYTHGEVECIDAIRSALGDAFGPYCAGNVIKYVWRYRYKNGVEDLRKAHTYLEWLIEEAEYDKRAAEEVAQETALRKSAAHCFGSAR